MPVKVIDRNISKIIEFFAILSLAFVCSIYFWLLKNDFNVETLLSAIGYAMTLTGILWFAWDRWLWKAVPRFIKQYKIENINGRWAGTYQRQSNDGDGKEHKYILEIEQTYSKISCTTYQDNKTSSVGAVCELCVFGDGRSLALVFYWEGKTTTFEQNKNFKVNSNYSGTTTLNISPSTGKSKAKLSGPYFTNRNTVGYVNVVFQGKNLKNRFED